MAENLKIAISPNTFKDAVTEHDIFVDKSLFIKEVIDSVERAILITRPRRWGKTLNLDMLKDFFEPEIEDGKPKLFEAQENRQIFEKLTIGMGGYVDTKEITYRIILLKDNALVGDYNKWIEIARTLDFSDKEYVLKNCKTNQDTNEQLKSIVRQHILTLKAKFSDISNLKSLITEYHIAKDRMDSGRKEEKPVLEQKRNEKLGLLRQAIEGKIEEWEKSGHANYQAVKQEFDLMSRNQGKYPVIFMTLKM